MSIVHLIASYGDVGLFVMLVLEYVILVVPGETTLTTVGVLWRGGSYHFHFWELLVVASLGTFTGSMLAYGIGRYVGRPILLKYGKYVLLTEKRLKQSEALFRRRTLLTLVISKYIAVVRDIVPYIAGINRVPLKMYIPVTLIASFLWTGTFIAAGGVIGQVWAVVRRHWKVYLIPAILIIVAAGVIYWLIHRRLHRFVSKQADSDQQTHGQ